MAETKTIRLITAPQSIQGIKDYCPRGGQYGVYLTENKLQKFAKRIGKDYIDAVIPLPVHEQSHPEDCLCDHNSFDSAIYWETDKGSHGWCCSVCGLVVQWG